MTLRLYLSKKLAVELPGIQGYTNRVLELVQEYEQAAAGNLILHVIDPEPLFRRRRSGSRVWTPGRTAGRGKHAILFWTGGHQRHG